METQNKHPKSLLEAVRYFSDASVATEYFAKMRWPDGVICPNCGSNKVTFLKNQNRWQCHTKHPKRQFSAKVGTIFEDSALGLDKWFVAVWSITNAKNGISSCELARALEITQKSAWHMLHRIRHAMHVGSFDKFTGEVESDESYVGGAAENMHRSRRRAKIKSPGPAGKVIVHGVLNRNAECSKVVAAVVPDARRGTLTKNLRNAVELGATVYTDTHPAYFRLGTDFVHAMVDHAKTYVEGRCHTNGLENFWSLLKRSVSGTYVSVDAPHLEKYVDEQVFRFNERKLDDGQRFRKVLPGVIGKKLTYAMLIGANTAENLIPSDEPEKNGPVN